MKITRNIILTSIVGLGATAGTTTGVYFAVQNAKDGEKLKSYDGQIVLRKDKLVKDSISKKFPLIFDSITFDLGRSGSKTIDYAKWNKAVENNDVKAQEDFGDEVNKTFFELMKETKSNPKMIITTPITTFTNDYFDIFNWKNTIDMIDFFLNEVSWGPEILTLSSFDIVRGKSQDGGVIALGGHAGGRGNTRIIFYPDSFFGILPIYEPGRSGGYVDTASLPVNSSKVLALSLIEKIQKEIFGDGKLERLSQPLKGSDMTKGKNLKLTTYDKDGNPQVESVPTYLYPFEQDGSLDDILNKENIDKYINILSTKTISKMGDTLLLKGSSGNNFKSGSIIPGNFDSIEEFSSFLSTHQGVELESAYVVKSGSTEKIVYPKRYLRRLFLTTFTNPSYSHTNTSFDSLDSQRFQNYREDKFGNVERNIDESLGKTTKYYLLNDKDSSKTDPEGVRLFQNFDSFAPALPVSMVDFISKSIFVSLGVETKMTVESSDTDYFGVHKVSLLYETYYGLLDTFRDYKKKYGWSPISFDQNQNGVIGESFPILYAWKIFRDSKNPDQRPISLKDYLDAKNISTDFSAFKDQQKESLTPINDFGVNWLRYVTAHEYGHHQTLNYAKSITTTIDPNVNAFASGEVERSEGLYNTERQVFIGATEYQHSYETAYSKDAVNGYLRSRTGGGDLRDYDLSLAKSHNLDPLTVQISPDSKKAVPRFAVIDDGSRDSGQDQPASEFDDFSASWRGFKTPDHMIESSATPAQVLEWRRNHPQGDPSTYPLNGFLMNSLDESSYSLNPLLTFPYVAFKKDGEGAGLLPYEPSEGETFHSYTLRGWNEIGQGEENTRVNSELVRLINYKQEYVDSQNLPIIADARYQSQYYADISTLPWKVKTGENAKELIKLPQNMMSEFYEATVDYDHLPESYFDDDHLKNAKSLEGNIAANIKDYRNNFELNNLSSATNFFVNLYYDPQTKKYITYKEYSNQGQPTSFVQKENLHVVSASMQVLIGRIITKPILIAATLDNPEWKKLNDPQDRKEAILSWIAKELSKQDDGKNGDASANDGYIGRKVLVGEPLESTVLGKEHFQAWLKQGSGLDEYQDNGDEQLAFLTQYSGSLFETYWKRIGFFNEYSESPAAFHPSTAMLFFCARAEASASSKLSEVYNTYLSTGAYKRYKQIKSDYQFNLQEMMTRDMQQLSYSPSDESLDSQGRSEKYDIVDYSLSPVFARLLSADGPIAPISGTGSYDTSTLSYLNKYTLSGFWEDYAYRRKTDSSLYVDPEVASSNDKYPHGLPIAQTGKSYVNYLKELNGIRADQDISGFYINQSSGFGNIFGYLNEEEADKYKFIAFKNTKSGEVKYLPIRTGYSNQYFNEYFGQKESAKSLLEWHYDSQGHLVKDDKPQVGWTSDVFLVNGFSNALLKPDQDYQVYFTENQTLPNKNRRVVNLGSYLHTQVDNSGAYQVERLWNNRFYNNGFDEYSGTAVFKQNGIDEATTFTIRDPRK